jgi:hypothetical protein
MVGSSIYGIRHFISENQSKKRTKIQGLEGKMKGKAVK